MSSPEHRTPSAATPFSALEQLQARQIKALEAMLLNAEAEVSRLREALEAIDTHAKRLLIDQGRGLQAHITEALRDA